ncbi:MAG: glycosyltransferase family 4 protein [Ignavibacteriales bacterium]|nr:glycosyltransferase family 4 protein [Ignavibacteriales bacterium]
MNNPSQNRKLRIAFMMPGGVAHYDKGLHIPELFNLIAKLSERFEITVYSFVVLGNESGAVSCGNATVKFISADHRSHWFTKTLKILSVFIQDHIKNNYDVVVGLYGLPTEIAAIVVSKVFRIASVIYLRGGETAYIPSIAYGNMSPGIKSILTKWVCRNADALIVLTDFQIQQLNKFGITRPDVKIIHAGVDTEFFALARKHVPQKPYRFLHVANLNPVKDQATLLRTFALINEKEPSFLRIAGADHMHGKIHQLANALGITDRVEFLGYLPHGELRKEYHWADVLLHTSLYEAEGVVVSEAAAAGLLICGTNVGLIYDLGQECVIAVEPGDYETLASETLKALESPEVCSKLVANSQIWTKHENLLTSVEKLTALFSST